MEDTNKETLDSIFDAGLALHGKVTDSVDDTSSEERQSLVKRAILMLEDATRLVSILDIFSRNENYKEIQTEHLKYFLLPVLLGDLTSMVTHIDRGETVETAQIYYIDFLQRCEDYGLSHLGSIPTLVKIKEEEETCSEERNKSLDFMNSERNKKMARYRQNKELEADIQGLNLLLAQGRDLEILRQLYLKLIQKFINSSLDSVCSLVLEVSMLRHMAKVRSGQVQSPATEETTKPVPSLQPIVITKDKFQKCVYGLGYPSLPVLSVDEFYEKRVREGWWQPPAQSGTALQDRAKDKELEARLREQEEREKDEEIDRDCPEARAKAVAWEEWKDDHRRGEGNRKNMG